MHSPKHKTSYGFLRFSAPILLLCITCFTVNAARATDSPSHFVKGPTPGDRKIIIFVHGLWGDTESTWTNPTNHAYWPKLVADDPSFKEYDIYVYGYLSPYISTASSLTEVSQRMGQQLKDRKIFESYDEIFFVTHSAGGIVTKAMLDTLHTPLEGRLLQKVRCVLYISVPTNGANLSALAKWLSNNPQLKSLDPKGAADFLRFTESEWDQILHDRSPSSPFPKAFSAYETLPWNGVTIVPELYTSSQSDGTLGFDYNHETIVKPLDQTSEIYEWAKSRILDASKIRAVGPVAQNAPPVSPKKDLGDVDSATRAKHGIVAELTPYAWIWHGVTKIGVEEAHGTTVQEVHGITYGLVAIVMVHNASSKPLHVQALEIAGDAPIGGKEYEDIFYLAGHPQSFSMADYNMRQPFIELSWVVWPQDNVTVEANDRKFIPFVIADPTDQFAQFFSAIPSLRGPDGGMVFVGLRNPEKRPESVVRIPTIWPIVHFKSSVKSSFMPSNNEFRDPELRPAVRTGAIKFRLRLDSGRIPLRPQDIHAPRIEFFQKDWETGPVPIQDLFYGRVGWDKAEPVNKDPAMEPK